LTTDESVRLDPAAVEALYAAHAEELRAFLIGVLRDGELAQEAVQTTFGKLVEVGHTAREETLKGWLFRVAYHEALVLRRKQNVQQRSLLRLAELVQRAPESPDCRLRQQDVTDQVRNAIGRLTPEQRIIVQMRIYEEKNFAVIAGELELPLGTVLTRMRAALKSLRRDLESQEL
jgi:RNA polymerase sigma factor (sigma-70 family)